MGKTLVPHSFTTEDREKASPIFENLRGKRDGISLSAMNIVAVPTVVRAEADLLCGKETADRASCDAIR